MLVLRCIWKPFENRKNETSEGMPPTFTLALEWCKCWKQADLQIDALDQIRSSIEVQKKTKA